VSSRSASFVRIPTASASSRPTQDARVPTREVLVVDQQGLVGERGQTRGQRDGAGGRSYLRGLTTEAATWLAGNRRRRCSSYQVRLPPSPAGERGREKALRPIRRPGLLPDLYQVAHLRCLCRMEHDRGEGGGTGEMSAARTRCCKEALQP
jgi:hypothetical protein